MLLEQQLGAKDIVVSTNTSAEQLRTLIIENYPKLFNVGFELMKADDGGPSRPLRRIDAEIMVPSFMVIKSALGAAGKIIYIRPITSLVQDDVERSEDLNGFSTMFTNIDTIVADRSAEDEFPGVEHDISSDQSEESGEDPSLPSTSRIATRVAEAEVNSPMSTQTEDEDFLTHEDFQNSLYADNPGVQPITVIRNNFTEQVLGMYLKDSSLDLKKKPKVFFIGESGVDLGGLTKEFFNEALVSVLNETYSGSIIFEGVLDHKLPSRDLVLLRCGVFRAVGKLMAHSYMHTGVAAYGLSRAIVEYCLKDVDSQSSLSMDAEDIPSPNEKEFVTMVDHWSQIPCDNLSSEDRNKIKEFAERENCNHEVTYINKNDFWQLVNENTPDEIVNLIRKWKVESHKSSLSLEEFESLKEFANPIGFHRPLVLENKLLLKEVILYNAVIDSRKSQLDDLKRGFFETGVANFLRNRPYLWDSAFPNSQQLNYSKQAVVRKLEYIGEDGPVIRIKDLMENFLQGLSESRSLGAFIECLTASPILPSCKVAIYVGDYEFAIVTCSLKVEIPETMSNETIVENFKLAMRFGGFGRA